MFIYSIRSSTVKLIGAIVIAVLCICVVVGASGEDTVFASANGRTVDYGGIREKEDRIAFIRGFGLEVDSDGEREESFRMPSDFDRIVGGYNQIQLRQGLDLTKYKNRKVHHFSYAVTNYTAEGDWTVNLYIYRDRIIACDLSCTAGDGTVLPLTEVDPEMLKGD